jgi:hypothetical protein
MASTSLFAQNRTSKIVLKKGQVVKSTMEMKSTSTMMGGEMKTNMTTYTESAVLDVREKDYLFDSRLKKAKMKIESAMFNADYDSEDDTKKKDQIAGGFEKKLDQKEVVTLSNEGEVIPEDENEDVNEKKGRGRGEGKKKGGGMMRMMMGGGGDASQAVAGAFLIIPAEKVEGEKWRKTIEEDGLKTITEYTFNGLMGDLANVTAQQQIKGVVTSNRGGMNMTVNVNKLSTMTLLVDIKTGLITLQSIEGNDQSKTIMGDQEMESNGKSTITITSEIVNE